MFHSFTSIIESNDIGVSMKKEFPEVIFQLFGPFEPEDGENGYIRIQMIVVPYKNRYKGIGTKFFQSLIKKAKRQKLDIFLTPDNSYQEDDGMSQKQLIKWYEKLGFEKKRRDDFRRTDTYCYYV